MGDASTLADLLGPVFGGVRAARLDGAARLPTIDAWVHTEVHGWTLAGMLDEVDDARLLNAARQALGRFTLPDGSVSFPAPAPIATATRALRGPP